MSWFISRLSQSLHAHAQNLGEVVRSSDVKHISAVEEEFTVQLDDGTTYRIHVAEVPPE